MAKARIVLLYKRSSRDDELQGESFSIQDQKFMLEGYGPYQIATRLCQEKVEIPSVHLARYSEGVNRTKAVKDPYG